MNLGGLFSNKVSDPKWINKKGENDFDKMLNCLVDIGKKITSMRKKADAPVFQPETPIKNQPKEETVPVASYYDSTPRPLSEVFNKRSSESDRAIYKAREILGALVQKLNMPTVDIYLLRTDISRYAGDGTPATGKISFQIPVMTAQGDGRTLYADVDIVLGSLMPPKHFTDSVNTKFAFDESGMQEFLKGRDFDVLQNPKVQPETKYYETPGHLAGRGGEMITKYAQEPKKKVPATVMPGTELADLIHSLEATAKDIAEIRKNMEGESKKLEKAIETLPEKTTMTQLEKSIKDLRKKEKEALAKISALLDHVEDKTVEFQKDIWKINEKVDISKTPTYTAVIGTLIETVRDKIPTIKQTVDKLWQDFRSMTAVKQLTKETPTGERSEWELEKKTVPIEGPKYEPPKEEQAGATNGMVKKAMFADYFNEILSALNDIDVAIAGAKKELGIN